MRVRADVSSFACGREAQDEECSLLALRAGDGGNSYRFRAVSERKRLPSDGNLQSYNGLRRGGGRVCVLPDADFSGCERGGGTDGYALRVREMEVRAGAFCLHAAVSAFELAGRGSSGQLRPDQAGDGHAVSGQALVRDGRYEHVYIQWYPSERRAAGSAHAACGRAVRAGA